MNRRGFITGVGGAAALCCGGPLARALAAGALSPDDDALLGDLERRSARFFWEQGDPGTGIVIGSCRADGSEQPASQRQYGSIAVTGFGLAALCVAAHRGWLPREAALGRVRTTLEFFAHHAPHERGFFYHWMDPRTGRRSPAVTDSSVDSEVSTIDTALLLGGVLTARGYFRDDPDVARLATLIYERMDFRWMLDPATRQLRHGWMPESGYLADEWSRYSEATILYLQAIGSRTHAIPAACWYAWWRDPNRYGRYRFVGNTPIFTFQYSHAFVDYRHRREQGGKGVNWFANSAIATRAHRQFCLDIAGEFRTYSADIWGITASDGIHGYEVWGGPPLDPADDGTVVPCAAAGSLMFTPDICIPAVRAMKTRFGHRIYGRYGFCDAFQPREGWVSLDVQGLDLGITVLSAENLRSGALWSWYMSNPEARRAMDLAGILPYA